MFGEMTFCFIQFRQNNVRTNDVSGKRRSAERRFVKMTFGWTTIRKNVVRHYEVWLIRRFGQMTFGNFFSAKQRFGKISFRQNDDSMKWRFGKIMWPHHLRLWTVKLFVQTPRKFLSIISNLVKKTHPKLVTFRSFSTIEIFFSKT